jgi:uncharacterized membrane protein
MQLDNPFQMNDWEIKKFLKVILAIQFGMWGVIGLDAIGLQIPILRQFIGFIYLTFIPGIILLRILKLHKLGNIETLLYTVGLSISFSMFTGLLMNILYPLFGISRPISTTPLIITISVVVLVLCALCYIRDKDFSDSSFIDIKDILSPPALFLCLIPFLSIFGTYLVNFHHNNILLMLLILVIAIVAGFIVFSRLIPKTLYPLAVFVIAISLLYHRSLLSMYLIGTDVQGDYSVHKLVEISGYWSSIVASSTNAMLSVTILPTIYSSLLNMDGMWLFKAFYPLIFSFVPVGLYQACRRQTDERVAFLSMFFFVSFFVFFTDMIWLTKQQLAEFFFALLILLMTTEKMDLMKRRLLFIVFGASMVVSHYGTSYIFMFILTIALAILYFMKSESKILTPGLVLVFITMALSWYMNVGRGSIFENIVHIGDHIYSSIFTEFLSPGAAEGMEFLLIKPVSPLHQIDKYLHHLMQFFIGIGVIQAILKRKETKIYPEYLSFSMVSFGICILTILLPYFSSPLRITRLYHITLIVLAPFCVIGGETIFRMVLKVLKAFKSISQRYATITKTFVSVLLILFMLFNTGFIYEVTKDGPNSLSLSQEWANKQDAETKVVFYTNYIRELDVVGQKWLLENRGNSSGIDMDLKSQFSQFSIEYSMAKEKTGMLSNHSKVSQDAYIYLGYINVVDGVITGRREEKTGFHWDIYNASEIYPVIGGRNKVYSNGGSEIYIGKGR